VATAGSSASDLAAPTRSLGAGAHIGDDVGGGHAVGNQFLDDETPKVA
jgi:hypothetical protein